MGHLRVVGAPPEYGRSFDLLADAFREAGRAPLNHEVLSALVEREHEIDLPAIWLAMRSMVGLLAWKTGETPRSILETEFANMPSDDFWRAALGGGA
jgi:hypothetical protein